MVRSKSAVRTFSTSAQTLSITPIAEMPLCRHIVSVVTEDFVRSVIFASAVTGGAWAAVGEQHRGRKGGS